MPEAVNKEDKIKVWMAEDIFRCHYIIEIKPGEEEAAIIGPYRIEDMGISEISRRFDKIGFKNINMQYFTRYYHLLPHIRDLNLVYFIVQDHFSEIYGEDAFDLNFFEMELMRSPETVENDEGDSAYQRERLMQVYAQEKLMIDYISKGNYYGAVSVIRKSNAQGLEARTDNNLRDVKNYSIVFNTICRLAAVHGGAAPWDIDSCSRNFSIRIEEASVIKELVEINSSMMKEYCSLVRNARPAVYSPLVQEMIDLTEAAFSEELTLKDIAEKLNHSSNYLSMKFRKETGKTFSEFLLEIRLRYAKELLADTNLPIASVAEESGIPDNNYFSRIFRQREKLTPREYRKEKQKENLG